MSYETTSTLLEQEDTEHEIGSSSPFVGSFLKSDAVVNVRTLGLRGGQLVQYLTQQGVSLDGGAQKVFQNPDFRPVPKSWYEVAFIPASMLYLPGLSVIDLPYVLEAHDLGIPPIDIAASLALKVTDEDMNRLETDEIIVAHLPLETREVGRVLSVHRLGSGSRFRLAAHQRLRGSVLEPNCYLAALRTRGISIE